MLTNMAEPLMLDWYATSRMGASDMVAIDTCRISMAENTDSNVVGS